MSEMIVRQIESANLPAMTIDESVQRREMLVAFTRRVMVKGSDYGSIPGTSKDTLLKPGAEKLCTLFSLVPHFEILTQVEDWTGAEHKGEPFFYYLYRCSLYRNGLKIVEADGSCNSFEKKYRWRSGIRICPHCGQASIKKDKSGRGYYCFAKIGGCGMGFKNGDARIEDQPIGDVPNPDICDQVNTIQKMAQKRALVAATLIGVNASEFFTQDMEDFAPSEAPTGVDTETGEITETETHHRATHLQAVTAAIKQKLEGLGYTGSARTFLTCLFGCTPREWNVTTYHLALNESETAWKLVAEQFAAEEALKAHATPEAGEQPDLITFEGGANHNTDAFKG